MTDRPDQMWGTDQASALTAEGQAPDTPSCSGRRRRRYKLDPSRKGTRYEALEPIRQGVSFVFGGYAEQIGVGLKLRHDHGRQFVSDDCQAELLEAQVVTLTIGRPQIAPISHLI